MQLILITVIVPCRNEERHITETIQRIVNQKGAGGSFVLELLVIDGKSSDNTVPLIKEEIKKNDRIKLIINEKKITPAAFNLGIKNASGRYVCILGAHAEISEDYLLMCHNTMKSVDVDNIGGTWKAKGVGYMGEAIALAFQNPFAVGGAKSHNLMYEGHVDSVWGGFYKKEVFEKIGLFDEELIRNQDDELNYRLIKSGGKIWQTPSIKYSYICRNSIKSLFFQYLQYGYWKVRVIQKHKLPASVRHLVPGLFVSLLSVLGIASLFNSASLILFLGLFAIYLAVVFLISCSACLKPNKIKFLPIMPIIFGAFHFGYGIGFLKGIWDFTICRKYSKKKITDVPLTR